MTAISGAGMSQRSWAILAFCAASLLTGVHAYAVRLGDTLAGPILLLDHFFVIALTGGLLVISAALGLTALRRLGVDLDSELDALAFSVALGAGLLSTAFLLTTSVAGVRPSVLALTSLAAAAIGKGELRLLPALLRNALRELTEKAGTPALTLFAIVALGMTVQAITPPADYDSLMYHLRIPAQFLQHGAIYLPEDNLHVAFVGSVHMLYLVPLAAKAPAACALLNVVFALVLSIALLTSCTRLLNTITGRLAMVIFWGSSIVLLVAVTAKVDVTLTCYLFLGHYALLRSLHSPPNKTLWIVVAAVLLGFAFGIKYLGLVYIVGLAPVVIAAAMVGDKTKLQTFRIVTIFGLLVAVISGPWLVKNVALLGAPLYPYFSDPILPQWLSALQNADHPASNVDPAALRALVSVREPFNLLTWFTAPEQLTPEGEGSAYGANLAFVLLLFAAPLLRHRTYAAMVIPGLLYVGLILMRDLHINLRYLIPALPAFTIGVAFVIATGISKVRGLMRYSSVVIAIMAIVSLFSSVLVLGLKLRQSNAAAYAIGAMSREKFWRENPNWEIASYALTTSYVNTRLPENARVLLLFDGRGYGYVPAVLQDNVLRNWPLLIGRLTHSMCLESSNISHVLVKTDLLNYFLDRGMEPHQVLWDQFSEFADRCLVPVERQPGFELYRVRSASQTLYLPRS